MKRLITLIIGSLTLAGTMTSQAAPVSIKASIDSITMEQGAQTHINVEVTDREGKGHLVDFPQKDKEYNGIDVLDIKADTVTTDGVTSVNYQLLVQAFDPGVITFPPFRYAVGPDTATSDILTLKVLPVDLDTLTTINPLESVVSVKSRWYDYVPDWWYWVVIGIAVIAIGVCLWLLYRKNGSIIVHRTRIVPPYELAMTRLNDLRGKKLAENGHEKEYYTELTDILRQYLQGRFSINALEMSSTQILSSLRHNEETRMSAEQMKQILEIADFVKFAKVRPLPDDNIKTFNSSLKFVEDTKPAEPEPAEYNAGNAKQNDSNA